MKIFCYLVGYALVSSQAFAATKTLEAVLKERLSTATEHTNDLNTVASRNRIRAWLPSAPQVTYFNNDNSSWRAWAVSTSVPIPVKSLYRDRVEVARRDQLQAESSYTRQEIFQQTIQVYLECSVPAEMSRLFDSASTDQKVVASIANSLFASGNSPQSNFVAAEILARQLEAQVQQQRELARTGCAQWERWADANNTETDPTYEVPLNFEDSFLTDLNLARDKLTEKTTKKLLSLSIERDRLWSKYVPDLELAYFKNNYFDLVRSGGPPYTNTESWSLGVTIPITYPFFDNTDYKFEKATLGIGKMNAEVEKLEAQRKLDQARSDWMRASARLSQIWQKDLALADVLVESSLASYRAGKITFAELVLARRTKLDLKVEEIQLKAQRLFAKSICLTECETQGTM